MAGPGTGNITQDGFQMSSNTLTDGQMREALTVGEETPEPVETPVIEATTESLEPATTPEVKDKPKSKSREANDAIAKATFEREEQKREAAAAKEDARVAREEAAHARREVEELRRSRTESTPPAKREAPVDTDPEPQFDQFAEAGAQQYEKWLQAHARWGARQEYKDQRQREIQASREEARDRSLQQQQQQLGGVVRELMADPVMAESLNRVMIPGDPTHPVTAALMQSEIKKELISHFAQHPDELSKILSLPTKIAQYREMTRVEARLEFTTKAATPAPTGSGQPRETSKAHPAINPVAGSHVPSTTHNVLDTEEDYETWSQRENKRLRAGG